MADDTTTEDAPVETVTDDRRAAVVAVLAEHLGDALVDHHIAPGQGLWARVTTAAWPLAGAVARDKAGFTYFDFLSAIDWLPSPYGRYEDSAVDVPFPPPMPDRADAVPGVTGGDTRLQLLAGGAKPGTDLRLLLKADVPDDDPRIGTWVHTYAGAAWHERETHEMFGVDFDGFDDGTGLGLRPLLLPDGFEGTPLRKSFVLAARASKPWPGAKEPGESEHTKATGGRRRVQAPGVPGPEWGPR